MQEELEREFLRNKESGIIQKKQNNCDTSDKMPFSVLFVVLKQFSCLLS